MEEKKKEVPQAPFLMKLLKDAFYQNKGVYQEGRRN